MTPPSTEITTSKRRGRPPKKTTDGIDFEFEANSSTKRVYNNTTTFAIDDSQDGAKNYFKQSKSE